MSFFIFSRFSAPNFVKSRFLATQEELEALLWVCFTPRIVLLIFEEKIFFRNFFRRKIFRRKKISDFFVDIFGYFKYPKMVILQLEIFEKRKMSKTVTVVSRFALRYEAYLYFRLESTNITLCLGFYNI